MPVGDGSQGGNSGMEGELEAGDVAAGHENHCDQTFQGRSDWKKRKCRRVDELVGAFGSECCQGFQKGSYLLQEGDP